MSHRRSVAATLFLGVMSSAAGAIVISDVADAADLPIIVTTPADPLFDALTVPADAATNGAWGPTIDWPVIAIHAAVMPDGSVVTYGTPELSLSQQARILDVWDPEEGTAPLAHLTVPNGGTVESFCSLALLMGNGDFLIAGGNTPLGTAIYSYGGRSAREVQQLHQNRWYGTMTILPDGRPLVTGGIEPYLNGLGDNADFIVNEGKLGMTPEVYDPVDGWTLLTGATSRAAFGPELNKWWYPRQWVAPDGRVFGLTADQMYYLDATGNGSITMAGTFKTPADDATRPNIGATSTAVMYAPGLILQMGGNGYFNDYPTTSSEFATIIDISSGSPVVTETAPMANRRQWGNATVLPNGEVFVNGGSTYANLGGANAVLAGEIWNPTTQTWRTVASAAQARLYHASAILLPSGAVMASGGGAPGPVANFNTEIYYPSYLFTQDGPTSIRADRPEITRMNAEQFGYNATIEVQLDDSRPIDGVSIIALSSTTHSTNMGQNRLPLTFTQTGDRLAIAGPATGIAAPPGFYQLFVEDENGVPSPGAIIGIGTAVAGSLGSPTPTTAPPTTAPPTTASTTTIPTTTIPTTTIPTTTTAATTTTTATTTTATTTTAPTTTVSTTTAPAPTAPPTTAGNPPGGGLGGATPDYVPIVPSRLLDTRPDSRIGYSGDKPTPGQTITINLAGTGIPTNALAATLNITGTDPTEPGYVTVWPCDAPQPTTSNLNLTPGLTTPNAVITKISTDNTICIYTERGTHLIADLTGSWH